MGSWTEFVPKPLLPVDGRPVLEHTLQMLEQCGLHHIIIVVGYLEDRIQEFLRASVPASIEVGTVHQDEPRGSGDALNRAMSLIDRDFLVIAADTVFDPSEIKGMVECFKDSDLSALVGLKRESKGQLKGKSAVKIDPDGFVEEIIEKPQAHRAPSGISAAPVFIFSPKIRPYLEKLQPSPNGKYELATAIQNLIDNEGKVKGYFLSNLRHITTPTDLLRENFPYLRKLLNNTQQFPTIDI